MGRIIDLQNVGKTYSPIETPAQSKYKTYDIYILCFYKEMLIGSRNCMVYFARRSSIRVSLGQS